MSTETQTFADLIVIGMTDEAVLQSIEYHLEKYEEGLMEHAQVASELITALDNTYGVGSYARYKADGTLPSQQ